MACWRLASSRFGCLAGLVELGVGELQELLVVLLEGQRGQTCELARQLGPGLLEGGRTLLGRLALVGELGARRAADGLEAGDLDLLVRQPGLQALDLTGQDALRARASPRRASAVRAAVT